MSFSRHLTELILQPGAFVITQIGRGQLGTSLGASQRVQTGIGRDACQPSFHRTASFKTAELCKRFHKNFLGRFFNHTALAKKFTGEAKNSWAVTSHYLSKRRLVAGASKLRQFQVRPLFAALFVAIGQKRS